MTRTIGASLLSHLQSSERTVAWGIKITRTDATVIGLTSHDQSVTISALAYSATPGLDVASLVCSTGFGADNTEATIIEDGVTFIRGDLLAGRWDGAAFELFRFNWADVTQGRDIWMVGQFGNVKPARNVWTVELRSLRQRLQAPLLNVTQPTCRNRLGDSRCRVNMAIAGRTVTGTLTTVTSQQSISDSARGEATGFFNNGIITMTSGANSGLSFGVRVHTSPGVLTLALPSVYAFSVGDAYSMVAGCQKRLTEDCVAKFGNAVNFFGEPHLPGQDQVTA